jgi:hypothetical protein
MSKLPQTGELPHADEGFDPARVEEAFATFANRVGELESVASELRAELRSLRAERATSGRFKEEDWPAEAPLQGGSLPSADWVASVPPPLTRVLTVPRLALEGAFLLLVAGLAGLADLAPGWIVLVMVVAWGLVALAEWAAAAKRSHWRLDEIAPAVAVPGPDAADSTGTWDVPVVDATAIESQASASESKTVVTKLPVEPSEAEAEAEVEAEPEPEAAPDKPRRGLRRRRPAEASAVDPSDV